MAARLSASVAATRVVTCPAQCGAPSRLVALVVQGIKVEFGSACNLGNTPRSGRMRGGSRLTLALSREVAEAQRRRPRRLQRHVRPSGPPSARRE
jgi:hypothetical protein